MTESFERPVVLRPFDEPGGGEDSLPASIPQEAAIPGQIDLDVITNDHTVGRIIPSELLGLGLGRGSKELDEHVSVL